MIVFCDAVVGDVHVVFGDAVVSEAAAAPLPGPDPGVVGDDVVGTGATVIGGVVFGDAVVGDVVFSDAVVGRLWLHRCLSLIQQWLMMMWWVLQQLPSVL